jgi:hypothetical protein
MPMEYIMILESNKYTTGLKHSYLHWRMIVAKDKMYSRLKEFNWIFNGAEYDLYSVVESDDDDVLTFELNKIEFTLNDFVIKGSEARIKASCTHKNQDMQFAFIGTKKSKVSGT